MYMLARTCHVYYSSDGTQKECDVKANTPCDCHAGVSHTGDQRHKYVIISISMITIISYVVLNICFTPNMHELT